MSERIVSKIVGARHMGEPVGMACVLLEIDAPVILVREPQNPHDANAVRCLNIIGQALGYLRRDAAAVVARWMDEKWLVQARCIRSVTPIERRRGEVVLRYPDVEVWREQGRGRVRHRYAPPLEKGRAAPGRRRPVKV